MFIALSGMPCSGKSSVAKCLKEKYDFEIISSGQIFRDEAAKRGMSLMDFTMLCNNDPSVDLALDKKIEQLGVLNEGKKIIFDSRMAWHFVPNSFKVFITLTPTIMAERLFNSDRNSIEKGKSKEEAQQQLMARWNSENSRYMKLYGLDNTNLKNFNLVVNSADKSIEEVAEEIYSNYKKFCEMKL